MWDSAEDVREALIYDKSWDLTGYRRTTELAGPYLLVSASGTLIDTISFIPGTVSAVSLPFPLEFERPIRTKSDVGEEWLIFVHSLKDGMVILGTRTDVLPERVEQRFKENAARFGATTKEALRVKERSIDEWFDFAIVDSQGILRSSNGGIPFKVNPPQIPSRPNFIPTREIAGNLYAVLQDPVVDKAGHVIGLITAFEDVTDQKEVLKEAARFNAAVGAAIC